MKDGVAVIAKAPLAGIVLGMYRVLALPLLHVIMIAHFWTLIAELSRGSKRYV